MDNIIYLWSLNRLLLFCQCLAPICVGSLLLAVFFYVFGIGGMFDYQSAEKEKLRNRNFMRWIVASVVSAFLFGIAGRFALSESEFKAVAVYFIGKEVIKNERSEKVISIIDAKLDEWLEKVKNQH